MLEISPAVKWKGEGESLPIHFPQREFLKLPRRKYRWEWQLKRRSVVLSNVR